jgi:tricorn protease-like protein
MKKTLAVMVPLGFLVLVAGCASTRQVSIMLDSVPDRAAVKVSADQKGPRDFTIGETPVKYTFLLAESPEYGPTMYNIDFSRTGYETKTITIKSDEQRSAIRTTLDREVVKEVPRYVLVVSAEKGYTLETRNVRAWVEDIEREGMAASNVVRLAEQQSVLGLTMSPDGHNLYFSLAEPIQDEKGKGKVMANIRSVRDIGGGITQVTSGQWLDTNPSCSLDGKHLFFSSNRIHFDKPDLFRINTEKTGGIGVIRQTTEGANYHPSIASNGLVTFTFLPKYRGGMEGKRQIWTVGGENEFPTQLREGHMPAASPDGKYIAFIGDDRQLWVMPANGQNPVQLTAEAINKDGKKNPTWSPDGQFIVFASDVGKDNRDVANYDIWIIKMDGTGLRQLTTNGSEDDYPVVSPSRKHIYFVSNRGFKEGIWRIPFPISTK